MTQAEVITLIQTWIIANANEEITADVLRPILEAMVNQPNDLIGDLGDLTTTYQTDLVGAINEINSLIDSSGLVIYTGSDLPDVHSFPTVLTPANFYVQLDGSTVLGMWAYNGNEWIAQVPQRTKTVKKFVSLVGITTAGKSQVQWMAEAINLNITNGAVYECEDGDIIDFFVNISTGTTVDAASIRRIYTRLCTGATSVTSVVANDLMPDGSDEIPVTGDLIIELGNIGSDDVWTAFNADPSQPFDMDNEMFVSAVQDSEPKLWQWIGGTGSFGSTGTPAVEGDFLDLTLQPTVPIGQLYDTYDDIPTMLLEVSQATQSTETIIEVIDASDDTNITFAVGETKLQAYYQYLGTPNGLISDYRLVSAPYGNHTATSGVNSITGDGVDNTDPLNPVMVFPTPLEIGTYDSGEIDDLISALSYHEFACSDETSDLVVGTVYEQRLMRALNGCSAFNFSVITAPTGSTIIIDVQKNGTTVFSTKPTIDASEFSTLTAATPQVITGTTVSFAAGDIIKVVIDQVGSTIAGINLKAQITYNI